MRNCQILTRDGLDERENILERFFLGGFTSATRYNYGEEVKIGFFLVGGKKGTKLFFSQNSLSFFLTNNTQAEYTQAKNKQSTHKVHLVPTDAKYSW